MKIFQLLVLFTFSVGMAVAQVKPAIFPEDVGTDEVKVRCYCNPGVLNQSKSKGLEISYGQLGRAKFEEEDVSFTAPLSEFKFLEQLKFDLKAPVYLKEDLKILLGYKYFSESFNFNQIGQDFGDTFKELDDEVFKSGSLSLIVSKPLNEKHYLAMRLRYSSNGDFDGIMSFNQEYAIYKFLGMFGIKRNENFEFGIGLSVSKSFRRTNVLPFVMLKKTYNNKWGIEAILPGNFFMRYNWKHGDIILFGLEYGSKSYRIDYNNALGQDIGYHYNHSEIRLSLQLEHQFVPWIWGNIDIGLQNNFSSDFEGLNLFSPDFMAEPQIAPYFNIGLFLSPPKLN